MKSVIIVFALTLLMVSSSFAADLNDPAEYQDVIKRRCTLCHSQERIETSIKKGEDMNQILVKMMQMGANLTDQEKKVLGTFWGDPAK